VALKASCLEVVAAVAVAWAVHYWAEEGLVVLAKSETKMRNISKKFDT
jgi:hypothetical protein